MLNFLFETIMQKGHLYNLLYNVDRFIKIAGVTPVTNLLQKWNHYYFIYLNIIIDKILHQLAKGSYLLIQLTKCRFKYVTK